MLGKRCAVWIQKSVWKIDLKYIYENFKEQTFKNNPCSLAPWLFLLACFYIQGCVAEEQYWQDSKGFSFLSKSIFYDTRGKTS